MSRPNQEDRHVEAFGERVSLLRQQKGITQQQLAQKTKLSVDTIGAIEQGRRWARLTTLHKLSKGLGVETSDLFKGLRG